MHPTIFKIGPVVLSSYGLMLAIAFFVGMHLAKRRAQKEGISVQKVETLFFWIILSSILGARFLYTFVENFDYYGKHPLEFFAFRKGGLSFFGGLLFAIGVSIGYCKKHKLSFWKIADLFSPSISLGLSMAKIGCFLAGCCHGKVCHLPWAVTFNHPETLARPSGFPLHPSQLYESLACLLIFLFLLFYRRFQKFEGEIFLLFLFIYGVARSTLEIYRGEPGHIGSLTTAQFLSIPMVACAVLWWFLRRKNRSKE